MADATLTFRGETLDFFKDTGFTIWLRLMAINLDREPLTPAIIGLRNDWLSDSLFIEFSAPSFDQIDNDIEAIETVLKVAAYLTHRIEKLEGRFSGAHLNLLGLQEHFWLEDAELDSAVVLSAADRSVRLISQHQDILDAIIQRQAPERPRLGPPCPYCGIHLWHPKGQQCLECGWDWHNAANPVQHTPGPGRKSPIIACLQDRGNPFNESGRLRTITK